MSVMNECTECRVKSEEWRVRSEEWAVEESALVLHFVLGWKTRKQGKAVDLVVDGRVSDRGVGSRAMASTGNSAIDWWLGSLETTDSLPAIRDSRPSWLCSAYALPVIWIASSLKAVLFFCSNACIDGTQMTLAMKLMASSTQDCDQSRDRRHRWHITCAPIAGIAGLVGRDHTSLPYGLSYRFEC